MKLFFRSVFVYLLIAVPVVAAVRGGSFEILERAGIVTFAFAALIGRSAAMVIPLLLAIPVFMGWRRFVANLPQLGYALFASIMLQTAFSFLKSSIPGIVPFYADPALAEADRWLHGGVDPWVIAHRVGANLPVDSLLPVYLSVWLVPAIFLAMIMAVSDSSAERKARFLVLYLFCWVVIGNVLAVAGSSVGPVFYDALLGGTRFADLHAALDQSGVAASRIGYVQERLWESYSSQGMAIGTGISAFPSVHVAIATLTALYLYERSRWLAVPGLVFLVTILFLSVYTGYHYAIDGYVSIVLVTGAWVALRRVELTRLGSRWADRGSVAEPVEQL